VNRSLRFRLPLPAMIVALSLPAGCGGGGVPGDLPGTDRVPEVDPGTGDPGVEVPDPCPGCDLPDGRDVPGTDAPPGDLPADPGIADAGEDAPPECPGAVGCPCQGGSDCFSGLCVPTRDGSVCSKLCGVGVDCLPGWSCVQVTVGGEPVYGCLDSHANLCRPCRTDADCLVPTAGNRRFLCLDRGDEGRFCGSACEDRWPCPDGFECLPAAGGEASQCVPAGGGTCPCTVRYRQEGARTTCAVANEFGRCTGERTCDQACPAPEPAPEACNGRDDDCDGDTDEDLDGRPCDLANVHGTCPGTTRCQGGREECAGTPAGPEICGNGVDENCNGSTDEEGAAGCREYWRDEDRDGFGATGSARCLCGPEAPWDATTGGDCDDGAATIRPGTPELCNGLDDDCNGLTDEGTDAQCFPFRCDPLTGGCRAACRDPGDCQAPWTACVDGLCRKPLGTACLSDNECDRGFCVDGLCCDARCGGTCERCNDPGAPGNCRPVPDGSDPDSECPDLPASTCGTVGTCDGRRACRLHAQGTVCVPRTCASLYVSAAASLCDGEGNCQAAGTTECHPYLCDPASGACRDSCGGSGDCQAGWTCVQGTCRKADGERCLSDGECARGFCTDGVCCNTRCGGPCESCDLPGRAGNCDPVPLGEDPDGDCDESGPFSCGTTGACSGFRTCSLASSVTVCDPARCLDDRTAAPADRCDGQGTCIDSGTTDCGSYGCDPLAGACRTSCTTDGDCQPGFVCTGSQCRKASGQDCGAGSECASGFCVDGFCCRDRCGGTCESCALAGREGFCDPIPEGTDPDGECPSDSLSTCGRTGECSGQRTCALYPSGTECRGSVCVNSVTSDPSDACDGGGVCIDSPDVDCQPYACDGGTGNCRASCSGQADCAPGFACADGRCLVAAGRSCGRDADCASGFCTDGICCRTRCDGICEACDQPGREGFCDPHPFATDPDLECVETPPSTCGTSGFCGGNRTCALWPVGTICRAATCAGSTTSMPADLCDGSGTCIDAGTVGCSPYTCDPATGICRGACQGDDQCDAGYACVNGACRKARGQGCVADGECATGFCADGFCCNVRCAGTCESCDQAGRTGWCDPVGAGTDPGNECPDDGAASCGRTGLCSGNRSCALYPSGTTCQAAACVGDVAHFADQCNGSGSCVDGGTQNCLPYTCNAASGQCRSSCSDPSHCQAGWICVGGACLKDAGQACQAGSECASGACCDNVCRNLSTDPNHCGQCGRACQAQNGTNTCAGGTCVPSCNSGFGDCDGNVFNGCEQALTTLSHCGQCNRSCFRTNATATCAIGSCAIASCNGGFANCDGDDPNGCETNLGADSNTSGTAEYTGQIRGDTGNDSTLWQNRGSRWFWIRVSEGDSGVLPQGLSATVSLASPPGANYDLYVYAVCNGRLLASGTGTDTVESVTVGWKEHWASTVCVGGCEDSQNLWVYVKWAAGAGCGNYVVTATGNTNSDDNVACQCDSCPF